MAWHIDRRTVTAVGRTVRMRHGNPFAVQTVDKAMKLLGYFSPSLPEIGLSELARLASLDKAATRRFLVALGQHGFIEQNPETRAYRLGSAFIRFARIREATRPLATIVQPVLAGLAEDTGETAHASIVSGTSLVTIGIAEPQRATRVSVDPAERLPLHATASGLAYLAYAPDGALESLLQTNKLKQHTAKTPTTAKALRLLIEATRERGYGMAPGMFEAEVIGIAAPLFDASGAAFGAVAVASVASRFSDRSKAETTARVLAAAAEITRATGGDIRK